MSLVITLPDVSGFKAEIVVPCGGVETMVLVIPDVNWHSWRSLGSLGGRSGTPEVIWVCFHRGHLLRPAPVVFTG